MMASALTFLMMANIGGKDQGFDPPAEDPDPTALRDALGTVSRWLRRVPLYSGVNFVFMGWIPPLGVAHEGHRPLPAASSTAIILRFSALG